MTRGMRVRDATLATSLRVKLLLKAYRQCGNLNVHSTPVAIVASDAPDRFRRLRSPRRQRGCAIATTIRGGDETEGGMSWDGVVVVVVLTSGWIKKRWDLARPGKCSGGGGRLLAPDDDGQRGRGESR